MKTIRHIQSNKTRPITKVPFEQMHFQVSLGWEKCVKLWRAENPKAEVHSTRSNRIGCLDRNDDFNRILLRHQNTTILWSASGYNIKSNLFIFPKGFIYNLLGNDLVLHGWIISNTMYHWDLALLHTHTQNYSICWKSKQIRRPSETRIQLVFLLQAPSIKKPTKVINMIVVVAPKRPYTNSYWWLAVLQVYFDDVSWNNSMCS